MNLLSTFFGIFLNIANASYFPFNSSGQFIGSLTWAATTNCNWSRSGAGSDSYADFANDNDCDDSARTIVGSVTDVSSGLKPSVGIPYHGPGRYQVIGTGSFGKASGAATSSVFRFYDGTNEWSAPGMGAYTATSEDLYAPVIVGGYTATTDPGGGAFTLTVQGKVGNIASATEVRGNIGGLRFDVYFYPQRP